MDYEEIRKKAKQSLLDNPNASYEESVMALDWTDRWTHISALNQRADGTLYMPGTLDVINAATSKILRSANENTYYTASELTPNGQQQVYNQLIQARTKYPAAPKHFSFVLELQPNTPGEIIHRVHIHDRITNEHFGTCRVVLRTAEDNIVEIIVEAVWGTEEAELQATLDETMVLQNERQSIYKAHTNKTQPQKIIRAQMGDITKREAIVKRRARLIETQMQAPSAFTRAVLWDGLYSRHIANTQNALQEKQRQIQSREQLRAAKEPAIPVPVSLPEIPQLKPPRPTWPKNKKEWFAFFDYLDQWEKDTPDKQIASDYKKGHQTIKNNRSLLGRPKRGT